MNFLLVLKILKKKKNIYLLLHLKINNENEIKKKEKKLFNHIDQFSIVINELSKKLIPQYPH